MPLSEHEQRLLEQMERALYAEDPKFASSLRGKDARSTFRRTILLASLGFLAGIALLMTGVVKNLPFISVIGFIAMLGSAFMAMTGYRRINSGVRLGVVEGSAIRGARSAQRRPRSQGRFMERLEERWNRRRDENGR